jgi:type III secretion system YscQ/HrcQ family protein
MTSDSFAWARKVDAALWQLDKVPLAGNAPVLNFHRISEAIATYFQSSGLSIDRGDCSWCETSVMKEELGSNVISINITVAPLSGSLVWLMGREDVGHLADGLMCGKIRKSMAQSEVLQEGFYRYLVIQALDALQQIEPLQNFSLRINDDAGFDAKTAYCIDIKLSYEKRSYWGCLAISSTFLTSWQRHFASMREPFSLSSMASSIETPLSICAGRVTLSQDEWKHLEAGDFVLLDRWGYDPVRHEGIVIMMLGSQPLFSLGVHNNKLKVLDYVSAYEETMKNPHTLPESTAIESSSSIQGEKAIKVKQLPIHVTVELARLRMTVDQLMKLSPGNFLELPIHPEQEVALTVNGQKIGRAELVHLGEALGIRILETA